jgi:hypothetical protein
MRQNKVAVDLRATVQKVPRSEIAGYHQKSSQKRLVMNAALFKLFFTR